MDATTLGSLLVGVGAIIAGVVQYLGKRAETALTGYSSLTNDLQEERDSLKGERDSLNTRLAEVAALRAADQAEIARLRAEIIRLGGHP
ncbi:hypothetical protein [Streptomyces sp. NPDC016626]|uniref:hypothetical protein n=1 Tax=Streptomyces sp. NPDC016626 TaxID=3364968 RepID=UPI0036F85405